MKKLTSIFLSLLLLVSFTVALAETVDFTPGQWNETADVFTSEFAGYQFALPEGLTSMSEALESVDLDGSNLSDALTNTDFMVMNQATGDALAVTYTLQSDENETFEAAFEKTVAQLKETFEAQGFTVEASKATLFDQPFQVVSLKMEIAEGMAIYQQYFFREVNGYLQAIIISAMSEDSLSAFAQAFTAIG